MEQSEWRSVLSLQTRIGRGEIDLAPYREAHEDVDAIASAIRAEYEIPSSLSDTQAETTLSQALLTVASGEFADAHAQLADAFPSPCTVHEPTLQPIEHGRAACHLMDPRYEDGSVDLPVDPDSEQITSLSDD